MGKRRLPIMAILLILSIGNYSRMKGTEDIRSIEFLSIFVIGLTSGLLILAIAEKFKSKK
ncbi:hypothetical protein SAMN05660845_2187 [Flavobacterium swingsii]|jgi:hypothetical protein|uniref:Uncharacterized protein n=1 Tax=Flavobacterium swingsii TaxID=498292 RepID=A0A1I0ZCZ4_9FLAO|nr:hypothetical protein [Flavobacterium swingsii]SFB23401.1 hypothetical protein SAMN05660845_2187 [Flavobacterium swingsii]